MENIKVPQKNEHTNILRCLLRVSKAFVTPDIFRKTSYSTKVLTVTLYLLWMVWDAYPVVILEIQILSLSRHCCLLQIVICTVLNSFVSLISQQGQLAQWIMFWVSYAQVPNSWLPLDTETRRPCLYPFTSAFSFCFWSTEKMVFFWVWVYLQHTYKLLPSLVWVVFIMEWQF